MAPARKRSSKSRLTSPWIAGGIAGVAVFLALAAWLRGLPWAPTESALINEILAYSFQDRSFWSPLKNDYSLSSSLVHPELAARPLFPALLSALNALGAAGTAKARWISAASISLCVPALAWSLRPAPLAAALIAIGLLLAQARNGMLEAVATGSPAPLACLLAILAYGLAARGKRIAAGTAGAALAYAIPGGEAAAILLGLALFFREPFWRGGKELRRALRSACELLLPFAALFLPWVIRSWDFYSTLARFPLEMDWARIHWFSDTDSGIGHLDFQGTANSTYQQSARHRWASFVAAYVSDFAVELATLGLVLFAGAADWLRSPARRILGLWVWTGLLAAISFLALRFHSFARQDFLLVDLGVMAWLGWICVDSRKTLAWAGRALAIAVVLVNGIALTALLGGEFASPYGLNERIISAARALGGVNGERAPVLVGPGEGAGIAFLTGGVPVAELPRSHAYPGLSDAFIDRFQIRWTTEGETLGPHLKSHSLVQVKDARLWAVTRQETAPQSQRQPDPSPGR